MNFTNLNLEFSTVSYDQLSADCSVLSQEEYFGTWIFFNVLCCVLSIPMFY